MAVRVPEARELLVGLVGRTISTVTGRSNTVLSVGDDEVLVATGGSPQGAGVPIAWVADALTRLAADGVVEVSVESLGYRSAFVGAVLLTLPGAAATGSRPPRISVSRGSGEDYRVRAAGDLNVWWEGDPSERYWLEVTDRPDVGVDLHAPQRDASGNRTPGYSLIWWVDVGDVVFHDERPRAVDQLVVTGGREGRGGTGRLAVSSRGDAPPDWGGPGAARLVA